MKKEMTLCRTSLIDLRNCERIEDRKRHEAKRDKKWCFPCAKKCKCRQLRKDKREENMQVIERRNTKIVHERPT